MRRFLVAGNWKMNTSRASAEDLATVVASARWGKSESVEVVVCPPFPYLLAVRERLEGSGVGLGGQNAYHEAAGAFTGETSIEMLKDVGCRYVILGHSERRHVMWETDELIRKKVAAAVERRLDVILCVGELLGEREGGMTRSVLERQLAGALEGLPPAALERIVLAYEPVWAIGTGKTATPQQAELAHVDLRNWLASRYNSSVAQMMRILYGGSVNPGNAEELLRQADVDGALVGGASLKAETFLPIVEAAERVAGGR